MSVTIGVTVLRHSVTCLEKATKHNSRCLGGVTCYACCAEHDAGPTAPQRPSPSVVPSVGDVLESLSLPSRRLFDRLPATSCATNGVSGTIHAREYDPWQRTTNPRLHHLGQTVYRADGVGEVSM